MSQAKSNQVIFLHRRFPIIKVKIANRKSVILMGFLTTLLVGTLLAGCKSKLSSPYDQTTLKKSITLDVVPIVRRTADELVSHSDNVICSVGQSKDGYKSWFNMFAFHEDRMIAIRKYFFVVNDKPGSLPMVSDRGLRFDCEMVLAQEVFNRPYATQNAMQIAILEYVLDNLHKDINELSDDIDAPYQGNKMLNICKMLINQTFELIFIKLKDSPVLATRLSAAGGLEFIHINFGKGKIEMSFQGDVVTVKTRLGVYVTEPVLRKKQSGKRDTMVLPSTLF